MKLINMKLYNTNDLKYDSVNKINKNGFTNSYSIILKH